MVNLETVKVSGDEERHSADVACICVHGNHVFSGSDDGTVKMWSTSDLALEKEWKAHDYGILDVIGIKDMLFTSSMDSTIKVWSVQDLSHIRTLEGHEEPVKKMFYNGQDLLAGDYKGELKVWDLGGSAKQFYGLAEEIWDVYAQDNLIYFVRDRGLTILETHGASDKYAVVASLDGRAPMYVSGNTFLLTETSGTSIKVMDNIPNSYQVKGELKGHEKIINAVGGWGEAYGVSGGYDNNVKLWDLSNLKEVASCNVPDCVNALATSPDGGLFLGCSEGFVVKIVKK